MSSASSEIDPHAKTSRGAPRHRLRRQQPRRAVPAVGEADGVFVEDVVDVEHFRFTLARPSRMVFANRRSSWNTRSSYCWLGSMSSTTAKVRPTRFAAKRRRNGRVRRYVTRRDGKPGEILHHRARLEIPRQRVRDGELELGQEERRRRLAE